MKHHAEKLLEEKKRHDPDELIRCDNCRQKVRVFRTNTCPECHQRLCHACWAQHWHNEE